MNALCHDVVIAGGGLAGLSLARQLTLRFPDLDVVVLESADRAPPAVTHKIGESTVVGGADYLHDVLELREYLEREQLQKLGLRFFLGDPRGSFAERPEFGRAEFRPELVEWQLDRGRLETELRDRVSAAGVTFVRGASVTDVSLSDDDSPHRIVLQRGAAEIELHGRWFVDATGRRRLLQRKLGLDAAVDSDCSAAWFRVRGHILPERLVDTPDPSWSRRVPGGDRYRSTNHLMGPGYWVWLIPLPGGFTSVGIVVTERRHAFDTINSHQRARRWIADHEPALATALEGCEVMDFRVMRRYVASVPKQVFSDRRWVCVGEAAARVDPLYSLGTNSIAYANCLVTELIGLDRDGDLDGDICAQLDAEYVGWARWVGPAVQSTYRWMGNSVVTAAKLLWDHSYFPGLGTPNFLHRVFRPGFVREPRLRDAASIIGIGRYRELYDVVVRMLDVWASRTSDSAEKMFAWLNYAEIPYLRRILHSGHAPDADPFALWADHGAVLQDVARALFVLALRDVAPDRARGLPDPAVLDPWSLSLEPVAWRTMARAGSATKPTELVDVVGQVLRSFAGQDASVALAG